MNPLINPCDKKPKFDLMEYVHLIPYVLAFTLLFCFFYLQYARAEEINVSKLADSIYLAEGGARTAHPYGILAKYKHTNPRQACINTINHALRDWNGKGDFISFLQKRYAPIGASNDPRNLNSNWYKNVSKFYRRQA